MALIKCRDCGLQISDSAAICPACGSKKSSSKYLIIVVPVAVVAAFFIYGAAVSAGRTPEQDKQIKTIRYCEEQVEKTNYNPIAIGACELLKAEYIKKWGSYP